MSQALGFLELLVLLLSFAAILARALRLLYSSGLSSKDQSSRFLGALKRLLPQRIVDEELTDALENLDDLRLHGASRGRLARELASWVVICCLNAIREVAASAFARRPS